ncbi:MAG: UDP-N-acetylmuramyl-tripeptide synthetase [Patescibacteria group bacterium]|nr:UDP-N-acetylmuramyl-tripeptide synthetase [Patescibacteria group bacterium]
MKTFLLKIFPRPLLSAYHLFLSWLAAFWYGHPSEELVVIGVTGTNGKSTVVNLIAQILHSSGQKVGLTSTINYGVWGEERLNTFKMTMPGRFFLQKQLRNMVAAGCRYAIIESTSEGVLQHRHRHIHYDCMVFTNLAPEHLERHGGFENYKKAKLEYFRKLAVSPHKILSGKRIDKVIVANGADKHSADFLDFSVDKKITFSASRDFARRPGPDDFLAENVQLRSEGTSFNLQGQAFKLPLLGAFNLENALAAIATVAAFGVDFASSARALSHIRSIPGRLENIDCGQNFSVIVDYAPEPNALAATYQALRLLPRKRLIHILGSTGGGRDTARRAVLGEMAGKTADIVIVTNEDPYDDGPMAIISDVARGAEKAGKQLGSNLFKILDRQDAIKKALALAGVGDMVLITGKGSEQAMVVSRNKKIPWDDRAVVREELIRLKKSGSSPS